MILLISQSNYDNASLVLKRYQSEFGAHPIYAKLLADIGAGKKQYDDAIRQYREVLKRNPEYVEASIALASVLSICEAYDEAILLLLDLNAKKKNPSAYYQLALCYFEKREYTLAVDAFQEAIALRPLYRAAHSQLNELLFQLNDTEHFGKSYVAVLSSHPEQHDLRADFIEILTNAGNETELSRYLNEGLELAPKHTRLLAQKAQRLANSEHYDEALTLSESVFEALPNLDNGIALVKVALKVAAYDKVTKVINFLKSSYPDNQLVLAYEATCLKLTNRAAYDRYVRFEHVVKAFTLPVPQGYDDLAGYLKDLKQLLVSMHTTNTQPLTQTLQKGTQTPGRLLERKDPLLEKLKWSYEQIIEQYIAELPDDEHHPFFGRKRNCFVITGSWSVKLHDQGFHVNHVHPDGWISSACYIAVPDSLSDSEGCIRFGQCPLELGENDEPSISITPKAGQLVLFPSYMWHGTLPYFSTQMRLTAPFDVVPID